MTKAIRVGAEAEVELRAATAWYEEKRPGLGQEFLHAVDLALALIERYPAGGSMVPGVSEHLGVRRLLLRRFPFYVVYLEGRNELFIVAFAHMRRRPGYWRNRQGR